VSWRSRLPLAVLLAIAAVLVIFGIGDIQQGPQADPGITAAISGQFADEVQAAEPTGFRLYDFAIRMGGVNLVIIGLLLIAILAIPYRAGQRWAWTTLWLVPAWALSVPAVYLAFGAAPGQPPAPPMVSGPIVAVVAGASLLVDRRRFAGGGVGSPALDLEPA
jgi:hypothetical protein